MKDTIALTRQLERAGWTLKRNARGGHIKALCPCGQHLLTVSVSPSSGKRGLKNTIADIRRTGCAHVPPQLRRTP